jgi:hypothetical protein
VRDILDKIRAATCFNRGIDAVAEYIRRLWICIGNALDYSLLPLCGPTPDSIDVRFAFGIPAVWQMDAIDRMKKAIEDSGILCLGGGRLASLDFVLEPEAAAVALLPRLLELQDGGTFMDSIWHVGEKVAKIQVGHVIVICDCGGGTVVGPVQIGWRLLRTLRIRLAGFPSSSPYMHRRSGRSGDTAG